jgi:hypothetical protein
MHAIRILFQVSREIWLRQRSRHGISRYVELACQLRQSMISHGQNHGIVKLNGETGWAFLLIIQGIKMGILADAKDKLPGEDELDSMKWDDLYALRSKYAGNSEMQEKLAPFEHQAYAREAVQDNPLTAPVWAAMPVAYQAYKALGGGNHDNMTTPASLAQATAGMKGALQGLGNAIGGVFK